MNPEFPRIHLVWNPNSVPKTMDLERYTLASMQPKLGNEFSCFWVSKSLIPSRTEPKTREHWQRTEHRPALRPSAPPPHSSTWKELSSYYDGSWCSEPLYLVSSAGIGICFSGYEFLTHHVALECFPGVKEPAGFLTVCPEPYHIIHPICAHSFEKYVCEASVPGTKFILWQSLAKHALWHPFHKWTRGGSWESKSQRSHFLPQITASVCPWYPETNESWTEVSWCHCAGVAPIWTISG